jgi:large subunit ribosomal protein L3
MAGKMGNKRVTARKMEVLKVYPELNAIAIKGSLPGKPGGILEIVPARIVGKNIP